MGISANVFAHVANPITQDTPLEVQPDAVVDQSDFMTDAEYEKILETIRAEAEAAITPELKQKVMQFQNDIFFINLFMGIHDFTMIYGLMLIVPLLIFSALVVFVLFRSIRKKYGES